MNNSKPPGGGQTEESQPGLPVFAPVLAGAIIPAGVAALADWLAAGWHLPNEPLASLILGWSAVAAILASLFIMLMRQAAGAETRSIWIAAALAGMGVLHGFNAGGMPQPEAALWLHSLASLFGGLFLFALTVLPERMDKLPVLQWLPCLTAACCVLPGAKLILFPEQLHLAGTLPVARAVSMAGGLGFLVAGLHFSRQMRRAADQQERLLLAGSSFLFAADAFLSHFAPAWGLSWWLWQFFRLAACFSFLCFFLNRTMENIQKLRQNRDELASTRSQLADLIENAPAAVALKDLSGRFVLVNKRFEEIFKVRKEDVVGKAAADILPCINRRQQDGGLGTEYEENIALADGTHTFLTSCFPLVGNEGEEACVGFLQTDITERRQLEQRLQLDERIIAKADEAVVVTDAEAIIKDVNEAYTRITGFAREEVVGQNPRICKSGHHSKEFYEEMWRQLLDTGSWSGEIWDRRKDGEIFEKWLTISAIRDSRGATVNYVGIFNDITEKKSIERRLRNLLFYDPLTKLPNRTLFQERVGQAMLSSQSRDLALALFCIDLDRFKDVNDSLGHRAGDELLVQTAKRIRSGVRKSDVVARLCGDEFAVVISEIKLKDAVGHLARRLIHLLQQPFSIAGEEVFIDASIGISMYPDDGQDVEALIKNADTAMHFAKERAHGGYQFFRAQMNERLVQRITLEKHLRHALENSEFVLYYQPKHSLATEEIVGMEALIRWQHPEEGLISPAEFIPVAEESSVITAIGAWCLKTACRQIRNWERQGLGRHRVAVNLSSRQFQNRELLVLVRDTLEETGLEPAQLELEITESTVMEHPEQAVELLRDLRQLGVRIAIDDFGTGYSSLAYLKKFPVNTLKIDQSFVADLTTDADGAAIVDSIIQMSRSLNLEVVAEGVETREQADFFKERGCQEVQGYYFSRPMPPEQLAERLAQQKPAGTQSAKG